MSAYKKVLYFTDTRGAARGWRTKQCLKKKRQGKRNTKEFKEIKEETLKKVRKWKHWSVGHDIWVLILGYMDCL